MTVSEHDNLMGSKCSRTITKYDLHNDEYKANPNGVDSQAAIKVSPSVSNTVTVLKIESSRLSDPS